MRHRMMSGWTEKTQLYSLSHAKEQKQNHCSIEDWESSLFCLPRYQQMSHTRHHIMISTHSVEQACLPPDRFPTTADEIERAENAFAQKLNQYVYG